LPWVLISPSKGQNFSFACTKRSNPKLFIIAYFIAPSRRSLYYTYHCESFSTIKAKPIIFICLLTMLSHPVLLTLLLSRLHYIIMSNKTIHGAGTCRKRDSGNACSMPTRGKRVDECLTPPRHEDKFDCSNVDRLNSSKAKAGLIPHPSSPLLLHEFDPVDMFCKTLHNKSLQLYDQLALIPHLISGPVIGPVCMYITAKEGSEDMTMQNICNIGNKIMMRVVVTCHTDKLIIKKRVQFAIDLFC